MGRPGRRDQLPAQLSHRRGRGGRRRHLPQDRVPRAARPLRLLRLLRAAGRLRHPARRFLGPYRGWDRPIAVERGESANSIAHGWQPIGSHHVRLDARARRDARGHLRARLRREPAPTRSSIRPGSQTINKRRVRPRHRALSPAGDGRAGRSRRCASTGRACSASSRSRPPNEHLDRMVNIWNAYQCMVTFNMSRSASHLRVGHRARHGLPRLEPGPARLRAHGPGARPRADPRHRRDAVADGGAYHQYQPLTKRGNDEVGSGFNDDPVWLDPRRRRLHQGDRRLGPSSTSRCRTTTSRARRRRCTSTCSARIRYTLDRLGPHGLPLIGRADWNDCLNLNCFSETPGESFQTTENKAGGVAESVFIAGLFVLAAREMAAIAERRGDAGGGRALPRRGRPDGRGGRRARLGRRVVPARLRLLRARVGSAANDEGQIFIEPQGICVMAGIGLDDGRAAQALGVGPRAAGDAARHRAAAARLLRGTTSTSARSPRTRPATRRTPASSATPTRGS